MGEQRQGLPRIDSRYYLSPVAGAGWLAGIWLGSAVRLPALLWLLLAIPPLIGAILLWQRGRAGLALAGICAMAFGGARYMSAQPPFDPAHLHYYNGTREVIATGIVRAEPENRDTISQIRVDVSELIIAGQSVPVSGTAMVQTGRYPPPAYGMTVRLSGDLDHPERLGSAGYADYLERQGILSVMDHPRVEVLEEEGGLSLIRALLRVKDRGRQAISAILPEPHAALLTGILLGDDSGLPRELRDMFRLTGMTHIIAISGFNIAVLIALLDRLIGPLVPRRPAAVVIMVFLAFYAVFVGAGASVVRATLMGIAYLAGLRLMGRPTMIAASLFIASFLMTVVQPEALWDVGFQLSFAATLGLMLYAGPWTRYFSRSISPYFTSDVRSRITQIVAEIAIVTLAAQVLTLPLILYHFGRLPLVGIPANFLILPAQPGVMAAGGLAMLLGMVYPAIGQPAGLVAWVFLHYTITIVRTLAQIPGASVTFTLSSTGLIVSYLFIAAITYLAGNHRSARPTMSNPMMTNRRILIPLAGLALTGLVVLGWFIGRPDGRLHVAFLDVGQGDAIFIQTPAGRQVLIDGGRYPSVVLDELGRQMPFWDRSIDIVMATHPDDDHIAGLVSVVERYEISRLVTNGPNNDDDPTFEALLRAADTEGTSVLVAQTGETFVLDDGVRLDILRVGPVAGDDSSNEASIVALLTYDQLSVLLMGDAGTAAEADLIRNGRATNAIVLKAGHHGSNGSSSEAFIRAVRPQIVIISAGLDNSYGHPHPAVLERATAAGATILRTDLMGTLELESDGRQMWWEVEQPVPRTGLP